VPASHSRAPPNASGIFDAACDQVKRDWYRIREPSCDHTYDVVNG